MRRLAAALAGLLPSLFYMAAAAAQEGAPARAQLLSGLELRPTITVTGGHDSNPREQAEAEGSAFTQVDLGLRASLGEEEGTQFVASLHGSLIKFLGSDEETQHYALAEIEVGHRLSDELRLSAGASYQRDDRDEPATTFSEGWGRAEADLARMDLDARVSLGEYRERVGRAEIVELDLENYDYRVATAELRATFDTGTRISPLLHGRVGAFDYLEQRPGKPNRDALEHSVLAGAAVGFSDTLVAELGLRRTQRDFDEPGSSSHSRLGPDVQVTWDPTERLRLIASYGHYFGEPDAEGVHVVDATFAELEVEYEASERLTLSGGAGIVDEERIGTGFDTRIWRANADARWLLRERLHLLAAARYEQEEPQDPEIDGYRRVIVRAGLEGSF